ncbi:hypothetical protein CDAR_487481 [Caerostris darwini]|uniref:Uncharacterized protein n=1 Tax=Caerostris darwini TaxID=1538125 RepID=A0AAV4PTZ2_9ARAC|nr:hypothetical protein CDAR_487481 [Caerostris darwini]
MFDGGNRKTHPGLRVEESVIGRPCGCRLQQHPLSEGGWGDGGKKKKFGRERMKREKCFQEPSIHFVLIADRTGGLILDLQMVCFSEGLIGLRKDRNELD